MPQHVFKKVKNGNAQVESGRGGGSEFANAYTVIRAPESERSIAIASEHAKA